MPATNDEFQEMKDYVGFTEEDAALLEDFWPLVEPRLGWICDRFYERILANAEAKNVLRHESQVESLKVTLADWLRELLNGPHDQAYFVRRQRIGVRHVEVGLPVRFMFMAMSGFCQDLILLSEQLPREVARDTRVAIRRVSDLDLSLMTGTYVESRESRQLATLQDLIVSHMPVGILLLDDSGRVTAATNPAARYLRGRHLGVHWRDTLSRGLQRAADLERLFAEAVAAREPRVLSRVDADVTGGSGSFRITAVPLEHRDATVLLHIEDLTEAVGMEARMQQSEALARLGSLSAAVAHELRNPLAGMSAAIQVLVPSFDENDRRRDILGKFDEQVRRLDGLVNDLLNFARPGHVRMRSISLGEVVEGVVDLVRHDAGDMTLEVVGSGSAFADSNRVHEILLNLIQNAMHAAGRRGTVRVCIDDSSVAVEDDGPGVPEAHRDEVFQPFFTTRTRGTGLGLAICNRGAIAMGAELALAESKVLSGARFELRLQPAPR